MQRLHFLQSLFQLNLRESRTTAQRLGLAAVLCGLAGAAGCGSRSGARASAVSVTDPTGGLSGQLTSLPIGKSARLVMSPVNDTQAAGVDWSVTCGGSPLNGSILGGACGTLSPAHTPDGTATVYTAPAQVPIGGIVTITASVTSDPSATSSVTLTITPAAIVLVFSPTPATSLNVSATASLSAQLINDTTGAGVNWTATCGSPSDSTSGSMSGLCGSFSPTATISDAQTTYTAPAAVPSGGTVTVTATSVADPTRSISASITILPAAPPIAVTLSATTFTAGERSTVEFIGTVANDSSNTGLTWTVICAASSTTGNCGTVTPGSTVSGGVVTYKAPSTASGVNPVTVTATATATESSATPAAANATGTITAAKTISVSVTAQPASVSPLGNTALTASVQNDSTNGGVAWGVGCASQVSGACGSISNQAGGGGTYTATYTAPAAIPGNGEVTISASPNTALNAPSNAPVPDNPGLATLTIAQTAPSIAFLQTPPATLTAGGQATVSAVVNNDVPPGGITWTVRCGSTVAGACGYIQPYQTASAVSATYVAPPLPPTGTANDLAAGQVAIVTTSTSDSGASVVSTPVTIKASATLSIRFVPSAPSQVQAGTSVNLQAAVGNDTSNTGVDWQVCASGCGYFTTTPAIPAIAATPTVPLIPAVPAVTSTTVSGWPNNLPIPYTAPATMPSSGPVTVTAAAHADGKVAAVASVAIGSQATGPALKGYVLAGSQPVAGASVSLYVAGTTGYGSAATLLYAPLSSPAATTAADGSFTLSAGYTCPAANSQSYLVAAGGQAGGFGPNPNLALMTALGPCGNLSSTAVVVNEVTTVASVWPLSRFAANDPLTGNSSYLYLGSDSANTAGLANAFAAVNNLVDITTGQALFTVPAGNATVPYPEINTLADILNACTDSAGGAEGDGSACGTLFAVADPLGNNAIYNSTPPTNSLQAAFNIAQHPAPGGFLGYDLPGFSSVTLGNFVALASPASPFQPVLNSLPHDFSISLNYTGGGGLSASSSANFLALDGSGDLWITDTTANSIIEWNNAGTPVTAATGFTPASLVAPGPVAIDASGDVWICDSNGLTELSGLGTEQQGSPFIGGGVSSGCQGLAFDGLGNLWTNNTNSVSKFTSLGLPLSPSTGYTIATSPADATLLTLLPPLAIDDANNVWVGINGPGGDLDLAELNNGSGLPNYLDGPPTGTAPLSNYISLIADTSQTEIAINAAGDVWVPSSSIGQPLTKVLPYTGVGTTDQTVAGFAGNGGQGTDPFTEARGVAIDGAGLVWVASTGTTGGATVLAGGMVEISVSSSSNYAYYVSSSLDHRAVALAVDGSGNIWALLDNNTITEYVGLATPAVTPLAAAVKSKKLGGEP